MAVTSFSFFMLCVIGAVLYYIIPKRIRWTVLLILSYIFYLSGGFRLFFYILFTTVTTYALARIIGSFPDGADKSEKAVQKRKKKVFLALALILNFGLLYFVKYWNFTLDFLHIPNNILRFNILLPLGISFYIFQSMGYIIDVFRNKVSAEKNFFKFALFVSFFPQLTQGPIGRYDALSPQLFGGNDFSFDNLKSALKLAIWGSIKKLVIADRAAVLASGIIDSYTDYHGSVILIGIIFYCIQLYCDFSGGIDIVRAAAKLFGIDMAENFARPLFASSLADFWRRWHITLGAWLKDYLFYPLTLSKPFIRLGKFTRKHIKGKAGKILPTSLATFIVYFVIGIWHGASWKYILFGCWNGVIITASLLLEPSFFKLKSRLLIKDNAWHYKLFCIIRTNIIVIFGRFLTRAANLHDAFSMISKVFTDFSLSALSNGTLLNIGLNMSDFLIIGAGVCLIFIYELFLEHNIVISEKIEKKGFLPTYIFLLAGMLILILFGIFRGSYIASEFIYKQF